MNYGDDSNYSDESFEIKRENSLKVFILKEHRKTNPENSYSSWEIGFGISIFGIQGYRTVQIAHCGLYPAGLSSCGSSGMEVDSPVG